jgi:hypothetical protein
MAAENGSVKSWKRNSIRFLAPKHVCQAVHFYTKRTIFGIFWNIKGLGMENMYIYDYLVGILFGHLLYFWAIWYIYFVVICYLSPLWYT